MLWVTIAARTNRLVRLLELQELFGLICPRCIKLKDTQGGKLRGGKRGR